MPNVVVLYQAEQEVIGKHIRSNEWVMYTGKLVIYDREKKAIVLSLKSELCDSFIGSFMEDKIEFSGDTVSEVYGKVAKWYHKNGILFQN